MGNTGVNVATLSELASDVTYTVHSLVQFFIHLFQGYRIYYTTNSSQPFSSWAMLDVNTGVNMATLSGLASDVTYTIRMLAYSGSGQGPLSGSLQVRTNSAGMYGNARN